MDLLLDFEYVLSAMAWSLGGFVLGYFTATASRDLREIKDAVLDDDEPAVQALPRLHRRWWVTQRIAGILLVVLAVVSVTLVAVTNARHSDVLECQTRVNGELNKAIAVRAEIQDNDRHALDRFLLAVFAIQESSAPEEKRRALYEQAVSDYRESIEQSEKDRAQTPLPNPDRCD